MGLRDSGHAAIYCVLCVGLQHCEHSAAPLLFSCTVTLVPSVYESEYSNVFLLLQQNLGTVARCGERIETHTIDVWCMAFTVGNNNGKTCRVIWDNGIKVEYSK